MVSLRIVPSTFEIESDSFRALEAEDLDAENDEVDCTEGWRGDLESYVGQ